LDLRQLKENMLAHNPAADVGLVERALKFGRLAHQGQHRASGEAYIRHPVAVAGLLAEIGLDAATVAAGLLHDVVEDTGVTLDRVQAEFGDDIAFLVDGVTKLGRVELKSGEDEQIENLRKMVVAMARDPRVLFIKLADRLHNLRTLGHLSIPRRREIARETLDVFAPLAHRLGVFRFKWELEDLALLHLEPDRYQRLAVLVKKKRTEREAYIAEVVARLRDALDKGGIAAEIAGRPKHFYSIYKKVYGQGKDFSEIYDLSAVRVQVNTVKDCYGAMGIIHTLWKPIPGRFKDFIATPKPNGYQSLHTTVIGAEGEPFEIQIRTREMHRLAEYGLAAHWRYKDGGAAGDLDQKLLKQFQRMVEWQYDLQSVPEFIEALQLDVFTDEVFVFTPKGDVIDLPLGSCPVDFAYRIHTDIGHRCVGARVNGRIEPLDYKLKNGDIVQILTGKANAGPSWDWLALVKTPGARNRIRQWFKKEHREEYLAQGQRELERELKRLGLEPRDALRQEWLEDIARRANCQSVEDLYLACGSGGISIQQVVHRLREELEREKSQSRDRQAAEAAVAAMQAPAPRPERGVPGQVVRVKGIDNVLVRFAHCCNPIPGDAIIGYVTRGRGVSIHRADCPNMAQYSKEKERLIDVAWDRVDATSYPVEIAVSALDRPDLLLDVTSAISSGRTNILSAKARNRDQRAYIDFVLEIRDVAHLERLITQVSRVRDVLSVERVVRGPR
jgi:GTP pyrophosphokinase